MHKYRSMPKAKTYKYSMKIYKYSMRFRVPVVDKSDYSFIYNYDLMCGRDRQYRILLY